MRHHAKDDKGNTVPFTYAGPMTYLRHEGSKPMAIWWRLAHPMPERFLRAG